MEKIYIVFTSHIKAEIGHVTSTPIIAFASQAAAEEFLTKRVSETRIDEKYLLADGIFSTKWWIEEISLTDGNPNAKPEDRIDANWRKTLADNDWIDRRCSNCGWVINQHPDLPFNYNYCPDCGAHMVNPKC